MSTSSTLSNSTGDFASCNQERIQLIGAVQAHGYFAAFTFPEMRVHMISENFHEIVGGSEKSTQLLIGKRLNELVSKELATEIHSRLANGVLKERVHHVFEWNKGHHYDVYLFKLDEQLVGLEISPFMASSEVAGALPLTSDERLRDLVLLMKTAESIEELSRHACRTVRLLTGLDRVMLYRFMAPNMHGEVIAEDKSAQTHSFLNHQFPASDIPQQARDLYLRNQVRFIYDSSEGTSPIHFSQIPNSKTVIDLSDSRLRAVSPIHLEYLRNMGVVTSFSIAVTVDNRLWGLIACHGSKRTYVTQKARSICETLAQTIALAVPLMERNSQQTDALKFSSGVQAVFHAVKKTESPAKAIFDEIDSVNALFKSDGYAVVGAHGVSVSGVCPPSRELPELYLELLQKMKKENTNFLAIQSLSELNPRWQAMSTIVSGVLCILIPEMNDSMFMVFRRELIQSVNWGGDPRKNVDSRNYQGKINPRLSFESWTEVVKNHSQPWKKTEVTGIKIFKEMIFN
jgi:chemotaxis family two-component system sensor kinase Cph1